MIGAKTDLEAVREIGRRIRAYRLQRNLSTSEVAKLAGLNRNLEAIPSTILATPVSRAFAVSISDIT